MLHIKQPYIKDELNETKLVCEIEEDGKLIETWFSVEKEYAVYLCYEVADAFLIGLLSYAIRGNHDIISDTPISEILLYNIRENYLPILCKKGYVRLPLITAPTCEPEFKKTGFVGTGLSCGVDSFHTIYKMLTSPEYPSLRLTHFCINNVGAFNCCYDHASGGSSQVKIDCYNRSRRVAQQLGLPIVATNSNFAEAFPQDHLLTHTFSSVFAVFCLQKLWDVYYYSSGTHDISYFDVKNFTTQPCARYDILSMSVFSTRKTRVISGGACASRLEKIAEISNMKIAHENLHVCTTDSINCGKCPKCVTTQVVLDAAGMLKYFEKVFDLNNYYANREIYLSYIVQQHLLPPDKREPNYDDEMFLFLKVSITDKFKREGLSSLSAIEALIGQLP